MLLDHVSGNLMYIFLSQVAQMFILLTPVGILQDSHVLLTNKLWRAIIMVSVREPKELVVNLDLAEKIVPRQVASRVLWAFYYYLICRTVLSYL